MAHDEELAERIRKRLQRRKGVTERKMFGGLAFLLNGNRCCGVSREGLMLRLGNDGASAALQESHTREMDFTGKVLKSMVYVDSTGHQADADLHSWIERAFAYAKSLPAK